MRAPNVRCHLAPRKNSNELTHFLDLTAPTEITFKWLEDCVRDFVDDADHTVRAIMVRCAWKPNNLCRN